MDSSGGAPGPSTMVGMRLATDEKDDIGLFGISMDDKSDGEGHRNVLNEEGGGVGIPLAPTDDMDGGDVDGDGDEESDNGDEIALGWEDAYEQEV